MNVTNDKATAESFHNCHFHLRVPTRIEGKTNEESREVQPETLAIKATPLSNSVLKAKGAAVAKVPVSTKAEP